MKVISTLLPALALSGPVLAVAGTNQGAPGELPIDLYVLYAHAENSERSASFLRWLELCFTQVSEVEFLELTATVEDEHDVVVLDPAGYAGEPLGIGTERGPLFDESYARGTVLIGFPAAALVIPTGSKTLVGVPDEQFQKLMGHGVLEAGGANDSERLPLDTSTGLVLDRHGPFVGFPSNDPPEGMSHAERDALLRAICWAHRFDRARILERRRFTDRKAADDLAERAIAPRSEAERSRSIANRFSKLALIETGAEDGAVRAWIRANRPFFRSGGDPLFTVDEFARELGIATDDLALLERCCELLADESQADRAQACLERSTGLAFSSARAWRRWLDRERPVLFASDLEGTVFLSRAIDPDTVRTAVLERPRATKPGPAEPVVVRASAFPERAAPGEVVTLTVELDHLGGWHTYPMVTPNSTEIATSFEDVSTEHAAPLGDWIVPTARPGEHGQRIHTGRVVFQRRFEVSRDAPGDVELACRLRFQACDARRCVAPATHELRASVHVPEDLWRLAHRGER